MSAGTHTFGLHETLIEPQVLPPPPTRHALLAFVLTLAAILHIGTASWSDIHNGAEGYYAGSARELLDANATPARRDSPLLSWLLVGSYKTFGTTAMAARLPIALAMVAAVAFTFLIGERIAGFWRGFVAALIHLCSLGAFVWGRLVTPDPLLAAFVGGAIFCGLSGYQRQQTRLLWFAGVAAFAALACLTRGLAGAFYIAAIFVLLAVLFREARLRFRLILHWPYILIFLAIILPWPLWQHFHSLAAVNASLSAFEWLMPHSVDGVSLAQFLLQHLVWWFPGLLLVLPGVCLGLRKIVRPHEFELADALPLCWITVGFIPLLFCGGRQDYHSVAMWSALALWIACAWDRTSPGFRIAGLALAALFATGVIVCAASGALPVLVPGAAWAALKWMIILMGSLFIVSTGVSIYFAAHGRETVAITVLFLAMVPIGFSVAEGMVRFDRQFSLAGAVAFLETRLGDHGEVLYEGTPMSGSSLRFYLDRPFSIVAEEPGLDAREASLSPDVALERFASTHPLYLITNKDRVSYWQEHLTERFHIYHQETTCGSHVVVSNQP